MLEEQIQSIAKDYGIDLMGVAELKAAREALTRQGGALFEKYPRAISLGCRISDEVVNSIANHNDRALIMNYQAHIYTIVNQRLDQAALSMTKVLMENGYVAFPVPASQVLSYEDYTGLVPHKTAAHLAGLGWIGKSALLVTRKYGPRLRLATVYTDAPLPVGTPKKVGCGSCRVCVDACPPGACTGNNFEEKEAREFIFDAGKCNGYMKERRLNLLGKRVYGGNCGLCVLVCPFGEHH
jgi:epoxyqueuosine reductase